MARTKFEIPENYDANVWHAKAKAAVDAMDFDTAQRYMKEMAGVLALSSPSVIDADVAGILEIPGDVKSLNEALTKDNGNPAQSTGVSEFLAHTESDEFVVVVTLRRSTDEEKKRWKALRGA